MTEEEILRAIPEMNIEDSAKVLSDALLENTVARVRGNSKGTKDSICKLIYGAMLVIKNSNMMTYEGLANYAEKGYIKEQSKEVDF